MENKPFQLFSKYQPAGDQPKAIKQLVAGIKKGLKDQVLLGVTGSGKTFTVANVIAQLQRQVLVISHNKTLASQLYVELKEFFPHNRVEYFISYFDYYRPEAYIPSSDTFIDKTSLTNIELEALRLSSLNSLITNNDTIVVASVASIYGTFAPDKYAQAFFDLRVGLKIKRKDFFHQLIIRQYVRNQIDLKPGTFISRGEIIEIAPAWNSEHYIRVEFFGDEIEGIAEIDPLHKTLKKRYQQFTIYPASMYITQAQALKKALVKIKKEFADRKKYFQERNKLLELQRLEQRIKEDIDNLEEFGFTKGIENYSRHLEGRKKGEKPYTIFDFLNKDALIFIDESHMMIPQLNAMYKGDRSRKLTLVEYGFRLPSALDNRPLKFQEWEAYEFQKIYISATPAPYEIEKSQNEITKLIVRPTGLLDPKIEIRQKTNQIENIYDELKKQIAKKERTLILTTTKRFAEELTRYFQKHNLKVAYLHSEHKTFERNEILRKLRKGVYDLVIGINLLREGIDLPEVSLVIVLDADHESFFRNARSLIQITGRAARNNKGRVIFYADKISKSMQLAIDDNLEKRALQIEHNQKYKINPQTIIKAISEPIQGSVIANSVNAFLKQSKRDSKNQLSKAETINNLRKQMYDAAKKMQYERAAELRDLILELEAN